MTRRKPSDEQRRLLQHACDDCGARPGEWCLEVEGWAPTLHDFRLDADRTAAKPAEPAIVEAVADRDWLIFTLTNERFGPPPGSTR